MIQSEKVAEQQLNIRAIGYDNLVFLDDDDGVHSLANGESHALPTEFFNGAVWTIRPSKKGFYYVPIAVRLRLPKPRKEEADADEAGPKQDAECGLKVGRSARVLPRGADSSSEGDSALRQAKQSVGDKHDAEHPHGGLPRGEHHRHYNRNREKCAGRPLWPLLRTWHGL